MPFYRYGIYSSALILCFNLNGNLFYIVIIARYNVTINITSVKDERDAFIKNHLLKKINLLHKKKRMVARDYYNYVVTESKLKREEKTIWLNETRSSRFSVWCFRSSEPCRLPRFE